MAETSQPKLVIALPKGRMSEESLEFLFDKKVTSIKALPDNRKLIFTDDENNIEFLLVRSKDVGTYVEQGSADLGIIGFDLLSEHDFDVFTAAEFPFGYCQLCVAYHAENKDWKSRRNIRIATKYPNITTRYFFEKGFNAELIELYGSIEIAPLTGLSDAIVDLVSTGQTLKENHLVQGEAIMESTARLIVNHTSYVFKKGKILEFLNNIR